MLIANYLENDASIAIFFFAERRTTTSVTITKNNGGKNARENSKIREKLRSPPSLSHLSVNPERAGLFGPISLGNRSRKHQEWIARTLLSPLVQKKYKHTLYDVTGMS